MALIYAWTPGILGSRRVTCVSLATTDGKSLAIQWVKNILICNLKPQQSTISGSKREKSCLFDIFSFLEIILHHYLRSRFLYPNLIILITSQENISKDEKRGCGPTLPLETLKNIRSDHKMNLRKGFLVIKDGNYMSWLSQDERGCEDVLIVSAVQVIVNKLQEESHREHGLSHRMSSLGYTMNYFFS